MTKRRVAAVLLMALSLAVSANADYHEESEDTSAFSKEAVPCPPTPGVPPTQDVARGRCLFHSRTAFGQDPQGVFPSCATCHYGHAKTDRAVHLIQITNAAGQTIQVPRKTPSLLKARVNFPYAWDGRAGNSLPAAARNAILSRVEMAGTTVTDDQLDALAAFMLALPESDGGPLPAAPAPPPPGTLQLIALGRQVFFGKGTCSSCHPAPDFTNHSITTNQVHATFSPNTDPGAGFVGTGPTGHFKVPSLLFFSADAPFMHDAALANVNDQLIRFYNKSLALNLTNREMTGLHYWLANCLDPLRNPRPSTCD